MITHVLIACIPAVIAYVASRRHTRLQIKAQQLTIDGNSLRDMIEATEKKALRYYMCSHDAKDLEFLGTEIVADVGNIARRINSFKQRDDIKEEHAGKLTRNLISYRRALTGDHSQRINEPLQRDDAIVVQIRVATDDLADTVTRCHQS